MLLWQSVFWNYSDSESGKKEFHEYLTVCEFLVENVIVCAAAMAGFFLFLQESQGNNERQDGGKKGRKLEEQHQKT